MPVNIPVEMIAGCILHSFFQFYQLGILCCHVNLDICRDSFFPVGKPLDQICIFQRWNSHRTILIVNLWIQFIHFKLRYHIHHTSHFPVSKDLCWILIQKRNLVKRQFLNIFWKFSVLHSHQLLIFSGIHNRWRQQCSHSPYADHDQDQT